MMAQQGLQFSYPCCWIVIEGASRTVHGQDYSFRSGLIGEQEWNLLPQEWNEPESNRKRI